MLAVAKAARERIVKLTGGKQPSREPDARSRGRDGILPFVGRLGSKDPQCRRAKRKRSNFTENGSNARKDTRSSSRKTPDRWSMPRSFTQAKSTRCAVNLTKSLPSVLSNIFLGTASGQQIPSLIFRHARCIPYVNSNKWFSNPGSGSGAIPTRGKAHNRSDKRAAR